RVILIDTLILDLLESLKRKQNMRKNKNKQFYQDQNFVFTCDEGFPYSIRMFSQRLQRIIKHMDDMNKHITPHSFRHTHASLLIEANAYMKVISHRLGHATVATTDEIYGHLTRGLEKKASQQFSELMKDLVDFNEINASDHTLSDANHDQKYDHSFIINLRKPVNTGFQERLLHHARHSAAHAHATHIRHSCSAFFRDVCYYCFCC